MRHGSLNLGTILLVLIAWNGGASAGNPPSAEAISKGLQGWLASTRDLQGSFEQHMVSGALGADLSESGTFQLERPGRMRWDYSHPEEKVAIVDRGLTLLYVAEDEQMILGELDEDAGLLPRLLAGTEPISSLFEISAASAEDTEEIDPKMEARLVLRPLGSGDSVSRILLTVRVDDFSIIAADVLDAAGNRQGFRFGSLQRNVGLRGRPFEFEPPPGTEILGGG